MYENLNWYGSWHHYVKLLLPYVLIAVMVLFAERASLLTLGLTVSSWKRTLSLTVLTTFAVLFVVYLFALFWKSVGYLRVDGDVIYWLGMSFGYKAIGPAILYIGFANQLLAVALPEELVYRGYFQSRLQYTWKPAIAIIGSTLLFALVHLDRPFMLPHLLIVGPLYGFAFYYTGNIYPTVVAHYFSNLAGILIIKQVALQ